MPHALARKARQDQQRLRQLPVLHIAPVLRHSSKFSDNQKKDLTRRANQGYINIIARTDKARAEKSAAGFLFDLSQSDGGRTSRRLIFQPVA